MCPRQLHRIHSPPSTISGCLFPPSFVSGLGELSFLGLCWRWRWLRLGSRQLLTPALLLPCPWLWLALWRLRARLLLPSQRAPPAVLLLLLLLLLLPLLYLHQLLKAFRGRRVHNKPILQGRDMGLLRNPTKDKTRDRKHGEKAVSGIQQSNEGADGPWSSILEKCSVHQLS